MPTSETKAAPDYSVDIDERELIAELSDRAADHARQAASV